MVTSPIRGWGGIERPLRVFLARALRQTAGSVETRKQPHQPSPAPLAHIPQNATLDAQVTAIFEELQPFLGPLLLKRRSGILAALIAACGRVGVNQRDAAAAVATAFNTLPQWQGREGVAHLAPALMTLDTYATLGGSDHGNEQRLSTPGCALLATILSFPKVRRRICLLRRGQRADSAELAFPCAPYECTHSLSRSLISCPDTTNYTERQPGLRRQRGGAVPGGCDAVCVRRLRQPCSRGVADGLRFDRAQEAAPRQAGGQLGPRGAQGSRQLLGRESLRLGGEPMLLSTTNYCVFHV